MVGEGINRWGVRSRDKDKLRVKRTPRDGGYPRAGRNDGKGGRRMIEESCCDGIERMKQKKITFISAIKSSEVRNPFVSPLPDRRCSPSSKGISA